MTLQNIIDLTRRRDLDEISNPDDLDELRIEEHPRILWFVHKWGEDYLRALRSESYGKN